MAEPISLTVALAVFVVCAGFALIWHGFSLVKVYNDNSTNYEGIPFEDVEDFNDYLMGRPTLMELYESGRIKGGLIGWMCWLLYGSPSLYTPSQDARMLALLETLPAEPDLKITEGRDLITKPKLERKRDKEGKFVRGAKKKKLKEGFNYVPTHIRRKPNGKFVRVNGHWRKAKVENRRR